MTLLTFLVTIIKKLLNYVIIVLVIKCDKGFISSFIFINFIFYNSPWLSRYFITSMNPLFTMFDPKKSVHLLINDE